MIIEKAGMNDYKAGQASNIRGYRDMDRKRSNESKMLGLKNWKD